MPHFKPEAAKQTVRFLLVLPLHCCASVRPSGLLLFFAPTCFLCGGLIGLRLDCRVRQAIDDWVHDTTATPFLSQNKLSTIFAAALSPSEMTYAQFHRSIFELVDVWVRGVRVSIMDGRQQIADIDAEYFLVQVDTVDVEAYTVLLLRIQKLMTKPLKVSEPWRRGTGSRCNRSLAPELIRVLFCMCVVMKKISFDPTFLANLEATTPLHCELEDQVGMHSGDARQMWFTI